MARLDSDTTGGFGRLLAPDTVRIERLLPGPRERVWRYLTEPELRRRWLAAGSFDLVPGGDIELVFNNNALTENDDPPPPRFVEMGKEVRVHGRITECQRPSLLAYTWDHGSGEASEVRFDLAEEGDKVRLTVTHGKLPGRKGMVNVSAGWHTHLDVLAARLDEREPEGFWRQFTALERIYEERTPRT